MSSSQGHGRASASQPEKRSRIYLTVPLKLHGSGPRLPVNRVTQYELNQTIISDYNEEEADAAFMEDQS